MRFYIHGRNKIIKAIYTLTVILNISFQRLAVPTIYDLVRRSDLSKWRAIQVRFRSEHDCHRIKRAVLSQDDTGTIHARRGVVWRLWGDEVDERITALDNVRFWSSLPPSPPLLGQVSTTLRVQGLARQLNTEWYRRIFSPRQNSGQSGKGGG